jgi:Putative auto-transporter adhesin, head GIN domain
MKNSICHFLSSNNLFVKLNKINILNSLKAYMTFLLIFLFYSCSINAQMKPFKGSGKIVNKIFGYKNFDKINIQDLDGNIVVTVGKPFAITAAIDDNLESILKVTESNGELKLQLQGNRSNRLYIEETNIEIKICMPAITAALHSANSKLIIEGINSKNFRIKNNENGTATIKGTAEELEIVCAGNGNVKATEMLSQKVSITKRGNGNVYIKTNNTFAAKGSGNGNIVNEGNGKADAGTVMQGNGEIKYPHVPSGTDNGPAASKYVQIVIKNQTDKNIAITVKYPVKGSYGIEVKANDSLKEFLPAGTKLYKGRQVTLFKKPLYTVTGATDQQLLIK